MTDEKKFVPFQSTLDLPEDPRELSDAELAQLIEVVRKELPEVERVTYIHQIELVPHTLAFEVFTAIAGKVQSYAIHGWALCTLRVMKDETIVDAARQAVRPLIMWDEHSGLMPMHAIANVAWVLCDSWPDTLIDDGAQDLADWAYYRDLLEIERERKGSDES